jgi:hypothetical protein
VEQSHAKHAINVCETIIFIVHRELYTLQTKQTLSYFFLVKTMNFDKNTFSTKKYKFGFFLI